MSSSFWNLAAGDSIGDPPHGSGGNTYDEILRTWIFSASLVALCGVVLFGIAALKILAISIGAAIAFDFVFVQITRRPNIGGMAHAALTGLLFGLTLPPIVSWYVPVFGTAVAIFIGKGLFSGLGHYYWQPALVGRVLVQAFFSHKLTIAGLLPVLAPGALLTGDISKAVDRTQTYQGWFAERADENAQAILLRPPVEELKRFADAGVSPDGDLIYDPLLRETLVPWEDTIFGIVPGGIGETCSLALIIAGLYLIYRGFLVWQLPVTLLLSVAVAAAVLPVHLQSGYDWFPVLQVENHRAVGLAYVFYHLTSGELMLCAFLIAGDMIATPKRVQGQMVFAAGVGVLTVFMRLYTSLDAECYWSVLIMNTMVSLIDQRMKRPVLGLATN